ncbi:type II secretion system protein GspM [Pseudomonas fontis]|uniref:Type II secretion system protein M n=1 Tax=Pseudomonas fontis TaxID=2942633 RepID=A0ABT5NPV5_9PSED|nr:type II secretion system protein GspM [Pseudomonas fontis]MDD0974711.1 type II secretion system protein M [Pseudomonas fontis]MDD0990206.1 type II secretion system protein M [Pseudomonas fontis]
MSKLKFAARRQRAEAAWQGLAPRERLAVMLCASVLGGAVLWFGLIQPPLARIDHWQAETPKLRSQALALNALLAEVPATSPAPEQQAAALRQSLAAAGLDAYCQVQGEAGNWQLHWQQAPVEAVMDWLLQAPRHLALAVGESRLQRDPLADPEATATLSGIVRLDQALGAKDSS